MLGEIDVGGGDEFADEAFGGRSEVWVVHDDVRGDAAAGDGEAIEGDVPAELLPAGGEERRCGEDGDSGALPEGHGSLDLDGVISEVCEGDGAIVDVMDLAGVASVDAGEGEASEDGCAGEPGGELLLDAEAVHQREDAAVIADAGGEQFAGLVHRGGFEGADDPVDGADLGAGAGDGGRSEVDGAIDAFDVETVGGDGVIVTSEEEVDIVTRFGEAGAVVGADGAGTDDGDATHAVASSRTMRASLPVARRPVISARACS